MAKVKAILFDLDGTLRDTRKIIYDAYKLTITKHAGKETTEAELLPHVHHHSHVHQVFTPDTEIAAFEETYFGQIGKTIDNAKPYPMAYEVLEQLHKKGYKLGVVTTARAGADYLKKQNVDHLFEAVVGGNDTERHKPYPDPVIKALEQLNVEADDALLVGDMTVDVQASKAAGVPIVIGITHGFETREMLETAGAEYVIDSFEELAKLIEEIVQNGS